MIAGRGQSILVLLGAPGAGKGTQAGILKEKYGLLHVSTGDMLREAIKDGSETGKAAKGFMDKGELVPDGVVTELVIDRIAKPDAAKGVILDGYPRTLAQAESLDASLGKQSKKIDGVLFFRTSEEVAIQRLTGRRVCPKCGYNYHVTNMPPQVKDVCDKCAVPLIQRDDDKIETVKNRLTVYNDKTKDLIAYYRKAGNLIEVNGDLSAAQLFDDIAAIFRREGIVK
ncbi:MAG: adenylate kinase [Candidatus Omnitrophica bacterium]|jgi:adenylate kinase|nr:adenylate kinase [Candidatus Omnitrophota bacterium]